jgi:hypothetical protein
MALGTVLVLAALVTLTFLTLANLSTAAVRLTAAGRDKAISLSLAEAGIDDTVDQLRLNKAYKGTSSPATLYEDALNTRPLGTFTVKVLPVPGRADLVDVYSVGRTTNNKERAVRARVSFPEFTFSDGAMLSNGNITINGPVGVGTLPLNGGNAHVCANGAITLAGAALVDGRVAAAGSLNRQSLITTDALFPAGQSGAAPIAFPTRAETDGWKTRWIADAQRGTAYGAINGTPGAGMKIIGPAYIDGDIRLSGGHTLEISGSGPVYVNGSVVMTGAATLKNASTLIVRGRFEQSASSGAPVYEADPALAPTPPALIALASDPARAIRLTAGAANNPYSLIYAANGGIEIAAQGLVRGSLVAGGTGAAITASGNGLHAYVSNVTAARKFTSPPRVVSWVEI